MLSRRFLFQAEDGIRDLVRSRGLGDVYKRQALVAAQPGEGETGFVVIHREARRTHGVALGQEANRRLDVAAVGDPDQGCLLYTSDAADERSSVDLGGRRIIKKKKTVKIGRRTG